MNKCVGILLFLFALQAAAQKSSKLDSLLKINETYLKEDTTRIKLLLEISAAYDNKELTKALQYAEQAVQLSVRVKNSLYQAKTHLNYGDMLQRNGKNQASIEAYEVASRHYEELGRKADVLMVKNNLANTYMAQREYAKALDIQKVLLEAFRQSGETYKEGVVLFNMATAYTNSNRYNEALAGLDNVKSIAEKHQYEPLLAACLRLMADNYRLTARYYQALESLQKAHKIYEKSGNKQGMYDVLMGTANVLVLVQDVEKALEYGQKARELAVSLNSPVVLMNNYHDMGEVYFNHGKNASALENYRAGYEKAESLRNTAQMSRLGLGLARTYQRLGDYENAWKYTQLTHEFSQKTNAQRNLAWTNHLMGALYYFAPESLLAQWGIKPEERYDKSIEMNTKSVELFRKLNAKLEVSRRLNDLSVVYEKKGDYIKAYQAYKEGISLRDSINNEDIRKRMAYKETQFEFEKKEAELQFQHQLTAQELDKQKLLTTQQQQTLLLNAQEIKLKNQALTLSEKQKELQHLAYLKEKAEKQEKDQQLQLTEKDRSLKAAQLLTFAKEKALQVQTLAKKNALIGFLGASLVGLLLAVVAYVLWQRQKQLKQEKANSMNFTKQLLQTTEDERRRIASDLHDSISHELLTLKNLFQQDISTVNGKIDTIINDVRSISRNLHPVMFDKIGLVPNIEALVERLQTQNDFMVSTEMEYEGTLSSADELQLYRIIQEALSNVIKYAKAHAAKVTLQDTGSKIVLEIRDNGRGFNVASALNSGKAFGLHNIIERARAIGGMAKIESSEKGTTISITIKNSSSGRFADEGRSL